MNYRQLNKEFIESRQKILLADKVNFQLYGLLNYQKSLCRKRKTKILLHKKALYENHIFFYEYMIEMNEIEKELVDVNDCIGQLFFLQKCLQINK